MSGFKFDGEDLRDRSGRIGSVDGEIIRDKRGSRIGSYDGEVIRGKNGSRVAVVDGNYLDDKSGKRLISLRDVDRMIDGPGGGIKAALWWFFIR